MGHWEAHGKTDEWYTPKYIFDALGCEFDMDVASPIDRSLCHVKAQEYLTKNSLDISWKGFVWLNPPFGGRNGISPWLDKMAIHKDGILGSTLQDFIKEVQKEFPETNLDYMDFMADRYASKNYLPETEKRQFNNYIAVLNEDIKELKNSAALHEWISVDDRPLFTVDEKGHWTCTEDGTNDFIAALQYEDLERPNQVLWWIHHCVVEDGIGLCIVGDDSNEPAGWELECVTHWKPFPSPPKSVSSIGGGENE